MILEHSCAVFTQSSIHIRFLFHATCNIIQIVGDPISVGAAISSGLCLLCLELSLSYLLCPNENVLDETLLFSRKVAGKVGVELGLILLHG
jgi:hypothetical protein